jgi:hypothetical protein
MNSSIAASMIAVRRSAARSARLAGGLGEAFGGLVAAALLATRRLLAGFAGTSVPGGALLMFHF